MVLKKKKVMNMIKTRDKKSLRR